MIIWRLAHFTAAEGCEVHWLPTHLDLRERVKQIREEDPSATLQWRRENLPVHNRAALARWLNTNFNRDNG